MKSLVSRLMETLTKATSLGERWGIRGGGEGRVRGNREEGEGQQGGGGEGMAGKDLL